MVSHLPDILSTNDSRYILDNTSAVIEALIAAEEPINNTQYFHDQAQHIAQGLQAFIQLRHKEKWSDLSTHPYHHHYRGVREFETEI
jgi:nicotinamidase-related amidase